MGLMSDKNWIVANAVEAIAGKPPARMRESTSVTAAAAGGKLLDLANYTQRPGFGKVIVLFIAGPFCAALRWVGGCGPNK